MTGENYRRTSDRDGGRPSPPPRGIHLGRTKTTKTSGADHDEVVYLNGRSVEVLDVWIEVARIESGSVFRKVDR